jgi:L-ribulose-5-phosphate 3-epimerase
MRIGVRAHDFGKLPADELARRIAAKGMSCVQLAVSKAIAGLDLKPGDLTPGLAFQVGQAFQRQGVQIAVLGCYVNLIDPDLSTRGSLLGLFKEHLRFARDFGCGLVATETGSVNADYSFHPDNHGEPAFQALLRSVAALVEEAETWGVVVGIEGVTTHVISTPQRMRRLLDEVASNHAQVVFDPVNLLSVENWREQDRVIQESLDLFGDRIVVVHAKDFQVEAGGLKQVRVGQGSFNYPPLLAWLKARKPGISILLEEASESTVEECARFLESTDN